MSSTQVLVNEQKLQRNISSCSDQLPLRTRSQTDPLATPDVPPTLFSFHSVQARTPNDKENPFLSNMVKLRGMGFPFEICSETLKSMDPKVELELVVEQLLTVSQLNEEKSATPTDDDILQYQLELKQRASQILNHSMSSQATLDNEVKSSYFCMICLEDKEEDEYFNGDCGHGQCKECLTTHYITQICDGKVQHQCTDPSCDREIPEDELMPFIADHENVLDKYQKFKRNRKATENPDCRWCTRPGCDTPILDKAVKNKVVCPTCKTEVCFRCSAPYHIGLCNKYQDKLYHDWAKGKNVRKCPKCKARIQKDGGCNHMTCGSCHHEWCWLCGRRYDGEGHYADWNLLGCAGKQFEQTDDTMPCWRHMCNYMFWLVCCPIACGIWTIVKCDCDLDDCCFGCCCCCCDDCDDD